MATNAKHSKRYSLSKLDPFWRIRIFESIKSPRLKLAVSVLTVSGCRPSELELGVAVMIKNGGLSIGIRGTKVNETIGRGQPLRMLVVDATTPWGLLLFDAASRQTNQSIIVKYDAAGISQRLREKSREIWPRRSVLISAYTYRHFIGKSLKESQMPVNLIAVILGHATDYSQAAYGRAGGRKKSQHEHGIISAVAKNPIRHSAKTDRLDKFVNPSVEKIDVC